MSLIRHSYYETHFLFSNKFVQIIIGLRPHQKSNEHLFFFCTITVCVSPMILHQFYQLFTTDITLESSLDLLQSMFAALCILCTYSITSINFVTWKLIVAHLKQDYDEFSDVDELNIVEKYTKESKTYTYCFVVIFNLYFIGIITPCVLNVLFYYIGTSENVNLTLPIPINNVSNPGALYYSLLIYQILAIYTLLIIASVCFPSFLALVQHVCCQLSVIRLKICQPFRKDYKLNEKNWRESKELWNEFNWVVDIIKRYGRVMDLVDLINSFTKIIYLIAIGFMMSLIIFGFISMFQLSKTMNNTNKIIERCCYIVNSIIITYINFHVGQKLINHSIGVFEELCQIPFYSLSVKTQKLLLFVIARSMRPCGLSIGDLFASSHEIFSGLMQKAFSFAMVYYNVR